MCGIFGVLQNSELDYNKLKSISEVLAHRGPDDQGILLINTDERLTHSDDYKFSESVKNFNAAFLHRRLSIIDISNSGHQPMCYDEGNYWITYNGEVYNYLEIKNELLSKGYKFRSTSDTEVILAAYREWGFECVSKFNGIWAFAIYDKLKKIFFLSRDRLGVKPLYIYQKNNIFIFSSEIKAIKSYLSSKISINYEKIYDYLSIGQIFIGKDDKTFFQDVKQLLPGHNLIMQESKISTTKYWTINKAENGDSFKQNVNRFRDLFEKAISLQFRSDVPVGSCLSGGLDSSSIVSLASNVYQNKLHTFSAIWPNEKIDESFFIDLVNNKHGCIAHAFEPNLDDILQTIDKIIYHLELPLTGSSLLAQWYVFEKVKKENIKVVLDGEGSDEILAGYPRHVITQLNELIRRLKWSVIFRNYSSLKTNGFKLTNLLRMQKEQLFIDKNDNRFAKRPYLYNSLFDYLKDELLHFSLPTLLHDKDRNSMAHSVEARVPYLDHNLLEFAINIPADQKIFGTETKVILREAMKDVLPTEVYSRKDKIGFSTPIEQRFFSKESCIDDYLKDYILNSELGKSKILDEFNIRNTFNYRSNFVMYSLARFLDLWS